MTPIDLSKIQARVDAVNDARMPTEQRDKNMCVLQWNARRDLSRLLGYVAALERDNRILREMRATSEHVTRYQQVRPKNDTLRPDLLQPSGSGDLPIVEAVEMPLAELVREKITGLVELLERIEHEDRR